MLGKFELGDEVLDVYGVEVKTKCIYDEDIILYERNEFLVELVMRHVKILC